MVRAAVRPRVSLLMPNRNNARVLERVLGRLAANTSYGDFELIVIDDGSTDASREILRRWRDSGRIAAMRLIEREQGGVVEALNAGLEAATGELVVQLDADASVETPGWLERMVDFFGSDPRIGVVTAKIVFDWGEVHACGINLIGREGLHDGGSEITEPIGRRSYHQRVLRRREDDCEACMRVAEVDGGMGCCMMYRRELALELGGYDPGFAPVWFDDLDLSLSIRRHGLKVFFLPHVRVVHHRDIAASRAGLPPLRRAASALWWRARPLLPARAHLRTGQALGLDRPSPGDWRRLTHHYAYWRRKWGFDMLNPDMDAVRARWGDTEICWRSSPQRRGAGERIAAAYEAA